MRNWGLCFVLMISGLAANAHVAFADEPPPSDAPAPDDTPAREALEVFEREFAWINAFVITVESPATLVDYTNALIAQIATAGEHWRNLTSRVPGAVRLRTLNTSGRIALVVRSGRAVERIASVVRAAPFVMPADMQRQMERLSPRSRLEIESQVRERIERVLQERARGFDCMALDAYRSAVQTASLAGVESDDIQFASERIGAFEAAQLVCTQ